jgi:hypothetical protein
MTTEPRRHYRPRAYITRESDAVAFVQGNAKALRERFMKAEGGTRPKAAPENYLIAFDGGRISAWLPGLDPQAEALRWMVELYPWIVRAPGFALKVSAL